MKPLDKAPYLRDVLGKAVDDRVLAGANLLVMQHGEETCYLEAGFADISGGIKVGRDTLFRLYSMSKPVTAVAAMVLLERGQLDLAAKVSGYLPGFCAQQVMAEGDTVTPSQNEMTVHDLLFMTSGLVYGSDAHRAGRETEAVFSEIEAQLYSDHPFSTLDVANKLGACALAFEPSTHWSYGTSADVLGAVIEVASGMRFGAFLEKELFSPLDMRDTGFSVPAEKQNRLAKVYAQGRPLSAEYHINHLGICNKMDVAPAFESGGAGLVSTVDDYAKFAQMLLNHGALGNARILSSNTVRFLTSGSISPAQRREMHATMGFPGYDYGNLMRVMTEPGRALVNGTRGEYGWDGWLGTTFVNDPVHQMTFLVMMQKEDAGDVTNRLRNIVASALDCA
ncbi:MAG: serine hydrolase domain-containing protein [Clostridia bacterium]